MYIQAWMGTKLVSFKLAAKKMNPILYATLRVDFTLWFLPHANYLRSRPNFQEDFCGWKFGVGCEISELGAKQFIKLTPNHNNSNAIDFLVPSVTT